MEEQHSHIVHIHPAHHTISWHLFLLFIPAIAFTVIVAFVASTQPRELAVTTSDDSAVLGDQAQ